MLGLLKQAEFAAVVNPSGEVKAIKGYDELGEKIIAGFNPNDVLGKNTARNQWNRLVGGSIMKGNIDQMFKVLPDSAVQPGYTWTLEPFHR